MNYRLELTVFISGAVVMMFEIIGSRIVAPYLGSSLIIWTSLIGVILASLSVGYWWGGRLADRQADEKTLSLITLWAGLLIGFSAIFNAGVLGLLQFSELDLRISSVIADVLLFAPASIALGMVSPYATRLGITQVANAGSMVGRFSAISTVGSIIGTFGAGFFLIAFFGSVKMLAILSLLMVLTSFLAEPRYAVIAKLVALFCLLIYLAVLGMVEQANMARGFVDIDSSYNRIWVYDQRDPAGPHMLRYLVTGRSETQSSMYVDSDEVAAEYVKYYHLVKHFRPSFANALMIGGGAYTYPKEYLKAFPQSTIDVVEIDPVMTQVAKRYFRLQDDPRLAVFHEDGRIFLNRQTKTYDVMFIDAFRSFTIPFHLTTQEVARMVHQSLTDDGVVLINVISAIQGEKGEFLRALHATYERVFPHVYLFAVQYPDDGTVPQNIILVALKSEKEPVLTSHDPVLQSYLTHRWQKEVSHDMPILTDQYAPVDYYMAKVW